MLTGGTTSTTPSAQRTISAWKLGGTTAACAWPKCAINTKAHDQSKRYTAEIAAECNMRNDRSFLLFLAVAATGFAVVYSSLAAAQTACVTQGYSQAIGRCGPRGPEFVTTLFNDCTRRQFAIVSSGFVNPDPYCRTFESRAQFEAHSCGGGVNIEGSFDSLDECEKALHR